jgi:hypothetical protein
LTRPGAQPPTISEQAVPTPARGRPTAGAIRPTTLSSTRYAGNQRRRRPGRCYRQSGLGPPRLDRATRRKRHTSSQAFGRAQRNCRRGSPLAGQRLGCRETVYRPAEHPLPDRASCRASSPAPPLWQGGSRTVDPDRIGPQVHRPDWQALSPRVVIRIPWECKTKAFAVGPARPVVTTVPLLYQKQTPANDC